MPRCSTDTRPNDWRVQSGGERKLPKMYLSYVIYSKSHNRFYKGHCRNLKVRINEHNSGSTKSTKPFIPWIIYYFEEFKTENESIKREKYFKTAAGRRFLKKIQPLFCN